MSDAKQIEMNTVQVEAVRSNTLGKFPSVVSYNRIARMDRLIIRQPVLSGHPHITIPHFSFDNNMDFPRTIIVKWAGPDDDIPFVVLRGIDAAGHEIEERIQAATDPGRESSRAFLFLDEIEIEDRPYDGAFYFSLGKKFGLPFDMNVFELMGVVISTDGSNGILHLPDGIFNITVNKDYDTVRMLEAWIVESAFLSFLLK